MPAAVLQRGADCLDRLALVSELDVDLLSKAAQGGHAGLLDDRQEIETLVVGAQGQYRALALLGRNEGLAVERHDARSLVVQAEHQRRHVHPHLGGVHAVDAVAKVNLLVHDDVVVREDLLVLDDPAGDHFIGLGGTGGSVASEVDAARVVPDGRLDRLVHHPAEASGEVHAIAGVRGVEELGGVVVSLGPDRSLEHRAGGLVGPLGLALRLDGQVLEAAEHFEPVLAAVLVDHGHDLVARLADATDEVGGHGLVAIVHREVHEGHLLSLGPLRRIDLVDREGLAELYTDLTLADEAEECGGGADAVHGTDGDDHGDGTEHLASFRGGPDASGRVGFDDTIRLGV